MEAKVLWISAVIAIALAFLTYVITRVLWRIASCKYPPTQHVVRFDDDQLKKIIGKIKER